MAHYLRHVHGPFVNPPDRFGGPYVTVKFRIADVIQPLVKISAASPLAEAVARCHHVSPHTNRSF